MPDYLIMETLLDEQHTPWRKIGEGFKSINAAWLALQVEIAKRIHDGKAFHVWIGQDSPDGPVCVLSLNFNDLGITSVDVMATAAIVAGMPY